MSAPLPPLDERTRVAMADAFFQALAEFPKLRRVLERARDIASTSALHARVRTLNGPRTNEAEAEAHASAAAFFELAMRRSEERAIEDMRRRVG